MTARRILRRVLLAALLCVLLASAALAAETPTVDSIEDAQANLEKTVEKQEDSFVVSLPSDDYLASYTNALQNHILEQENWVEVSPRITADFGVSKGSAIIVRLRYAENHGEYKDALDAAAAACVRSGMTDVEKAASIYSWLADTIVHTEQCDTAYEALVDKRADCFGFAAAFRAIAREAGLECTLVRGKYSSSEHAWNAVEIGKSDDGTGGVWYYVDASRVDGRWIPGRVDYQYLLFGTSKSGYSADVTNISAAEYPLGFSRSSVCTPLALREDGFWLIRRDEHGTGLYTVSYGKNFAGSAYLGTISDAPMSILWAAVMVDDVVYYSVNSYGDTALYSYTPGMPEAEARETGLSDKFGLRLDGRTLRLVQNGQTVQSAKLRKYSGFAGTAWFGYDADAALPALAEANIRLLGQADGATVFAGFYDAAGRMLSAQVLGSAGAISPKAAPGGCTQVRFFAADAGLRPIAEPLTISGS